MATNYLIFFHWEVGSMFPPLESGLAYDNLDQYIMVEIVLCQLQA